jgi:glycosyltransferase involved in cell wall biosynthesis
MPAHNEEKTIGPAVTEILGLDTDFPLELIVVDDGSTDRTALELSRYSDRRLLVQRHPVNLGKGAAVLTGSAVATGTHMVVFDADREYHATDLPRMIEPIRLRNADVVFGTRIFGMNTVYHSYRYAVGNRMTTLAANILYDACLTDLHTCLKMLPVALFRQLNLTESGFGLDSELAAELLRRGYRPFEVPVTYVGRSHAQGKKITWRDGFGCLMVLGRVRLRGSLPPRVLDLAALEASDIETDPEPLGGLLLSGRASGGSPPRP